MVTIQGEVKGVLGEVFSSGLLHHVGVLAKCLSMVGLSVVNQCRISHLLDLGGPPEVAFGVALPIDMISMGSGEGCCLLGLGYSLGTGVGEPAAIGCSSPGEVLCGDVSGGDGGVCPCRMWCEAASVLLSEGGLLYKMT